MAARIRSVKESKDEERIKDLCRAFCRKGIKIRRENLTRGQSFRVRSGDCLFSGERVLFLDRRLPAEQQLSMLFDYIAGCEIDLDEDQRGIAASSDEEAANSDVN
jgi:hypothetical protein